MFVRERLLTRISRPLDAPPSLLDGAPLFWVILTLLTRWARLERAEAQYVGRWLGSAIRRARGGAE